MRIGIDLDGTICELKKNGQSYADVLPKSGAIERITELHNQGHTIVIITARNMKTQNGDVNKVIKNVGKITLDWLDKWNIPYDEIHFGEPNCSLYINDRALRFKDWENITDQVIEDNAREK